MAMALAAVVMAGAAVSCDPMDNDDENTEQTDDTQNGSENEGTGSEGEGEGNENEGTGNEGEAATLTLDGKQWLAIIPAEGEYEESGFCLDFGVIVAEKAIMWNVTLSDYKFAEGGAEYMAGEYEITPTDATSGEIAFVDYNGTNVYNYKYLTETSVKVQASCYYGKGAGPDDYLDFVIPQQPVTVQ